MLQNSISFSKRCETIKSQKKMAEQQVFVKVASRTEAAQVWGWPLAKSNKRKEFGEFARVEEGN